MSSLRGVVGCLEDGQLLLKCMNEAHCGLLGRGEGFATLQRYAADYFGPDVAVRTVAEQAAPTKSLSDIREEVKDHPAVKQVMDRFGAQLIDVRRPRQDRTGG